MAETPPADDDLTLEQKIERVLSDISIERVKGMLMFLYGVDADTASNLLDWRVQATMVDRRLLAHQLLADLTQAAIDDETDLRAGCDQILLTVHERITSNPEAPPTP